MPPMSYLVLARKYRPQSFAEVVGQQHVTQTLANAFAKNRVHHAFLLCGPRGVGKTTLARVLGKALNCENGPTAEPCGECAACVSINNGSAVDYVEMDGASNRGIDAIRDLTEAARYQPAALRKKVYVIDEVHMLTTEAFNALLKTLEEPPEHVTFVLATTEPHKLPNTILSRCQRYDFKLVPQDPLIEHLQHVFKQEQIEIEPGALGLIARESGGSVRDALSLADQVISFVGGDSITEAETAQVLGVADRALALRLVSTVLAGEAKPALDAIGEAIARGIDETQIARALVRSLRIVSLLSLDQNMPVPDLGQEERNDYLELAKEDKTRVTRMFRRMLAASDELAQTTMPRMVLELAVIETARTEGLTPIATLIDKVSALEARLAGGGGSKTTSGGGSAQGASRSVQSPVRGRSASPTSPQSSPQSRQSAPRETASPTSEATPAAVRTASGSEPVPQPVGGQPGCSSKPSTVASAQDNQAAAPAPAPAAPTQTGLPSWANLVSALGDQRKFTLFGIYERARVLRYNEKELHVGFTPDLENLLELAKDQANLEAMADFIEKLAGVRPKIEARKVKADEATTLSTVEQTEKKQRATREQQAEGARNHPITRAVLETFGGQIQEIRTHVK